MVRVTTRRGSIELKIRVDARVPVGSIYMPFCWTEAPANLLTSDVLDPIGKIPSSKLCGARVEKVGAGILPKPDSQSRNASA